MNLEMCPLQVIGLKSDTQQVLHTIRNLGCVHLDELADSTEALARPFTPDREAIRLQEEQSFLVARIEGLLDALGSDHTQGPVLYPKECLSEARTGIEELQPKVQKLTTHREKLQAELAMLPRYESTLRKLLPIIPASAHEAGNVSVGILVNRTHVGVLDTVGKNILNITSGQAELVSSDVDVSTHAMLIVFPHEFAAEIEALLGREDVSRLRLPAELGEGPPDVILEKLRRRMGAIPEELDRIGYELAGLAAQWSDKLVAWRDVLSDELDTIGVLSHLGETDMTFILVGWVPAEDFVQLTETLRNEIGETIFIRRLPLTCELKKKAPVILRNPKAAKPFESLVNLLALPRYDHIDPTRLMAFFLPIFFGMMLGDVGYGFLLLFLSLALLRKFKSGVMRDVISVLAMGSGWTIVFGFLYGEAFGTLGEHLGMRPLWFDRASSENVGGLLLMTLAVGSVHVVLGLILGVWEAIKDRSRGHLMERGGMLVGLVGLFLLIGVLANFLPEELRTLGIGGLIIGIVLMGASLGWLGILMGPIEFIGLIGNILSYLRIAAIGLASVYLAKVANDMAGMMGNLIIGATVAALIHALNLVLGAFSPTIHSLRLHYVEFFRKFYEGGGKRYQPLRSNLRTNTFM